MVMKHYDVIEEDDEVDEFEDEDEQRFLSKKDMYRVL